MSPTALNKTLGWFSLGLGLGELLFPRQIAGGTGIRSEKLISAFGLRELAAGATLLAAPSSAAGPLGRVGGDVLDMIAAGRDAFRPDNPKRNGALFALAFVGGALLLDAYASYRTARAR